MAVNNSANVLIVEDDNSLREALADTLDLAGYNCTALASAEQALSSLHQGQPSIVVSDVNLGGMSGHDLLANLKNKHPELPVLLMTAYGNIGGAVQAMRSGASDYLIKPFAPEELVKKIQQFMLAQGEVNDGPIVCDAKSKQTFALARKVAPSDATALITGPSGSGKEVIARYIHEQSPRADKPFIAINCAAIPENMLEATLFGHEKGAFTGAHQASSGKFEQAQGGTLLLDEISEMNLALQAKILRVLQEKEVERVGGKKIINLDVRILATSNRDLAECVSSGQFREDLYYRLNVFPIHCAPLCERKKDILPIAYHLLNHYAQIDNKVAPRLSSECEALLLAYPWPGNVREMGNVMQRALILCSGDEINREDLRIEMLEVIQDNSESCVSSGQLGDDLRVKEYQMILDALSECDGNRKLVAERLGISPRTLRYKLAKMREQGFIQS